MNIVNLIFEWLFKLLKEFSPAIYMVLGAIAAEYLRRKTSKSSRKQQAYSKLSELRFMIPSLVWTHQHAKILFLFHRNQWAFSKTDQDRELHHSEMVKFDHESMRFLETYTAKMGELYRIVATLETLIKFDADGMKLLSRVRNLKLDFIKDEPREINTLDAIDAWRKDTIHELETFIRNEYNDLFYHLTHYVMRRM